MAFSIKDVLITVFDTHPAINVIAANSPESFKSGFDFLLDETKYINQSGSPKDFPAGNFNLRSLPKKTLKTHFWRGYMNRQPDNPWKLQTPFVCYPHKVSIKLKDSMSGVSINTKAKIYLSNLGWSTNFSMRLRGEIRKLSLINFIGKLTNRTDNEKPFLVDNREMSLKEAFIHFQNLIIKDIYGENTLPHPTIKIERDMVISLNQITGAITPYENMTSDERGLLRGILFGREIGALQEIEERNKYPLTYTMISQPFNFALTHFGLGTLIFSQRESVNPKKEGEMNCLANNIKDTLMMTSMLLQTFKYVNSSGSPEDRAAVDSILENILENLVCLPKNYPNAFCQNLYLQHSELKKYR